MMAITLKLDTNEPTIVDAPRGRKVGIVFMDRAVHLVLLVHGSNAFRRCYRVHRDGEEIGEARYVGPVVTPGGVLHVVEVVDWVDPEEVQLPIEERRRLHAEAKAVRKG
jgi:hypothetical protein